MCLGPCFAVILTVDLDGVVGADVLAVVPVDVGAHIVFFQARLADLPLVALDVGQIVFVARSATTAAVATLGDQAVGVLSVVPATADLEIVASVIDVCVITVEVGAQQLVVQFAPN